jgi:hypothetical protein
MLLTGHKSSDFPLCLGFAFEERLKPKRINKLVYVFQEKCKKRALESGGGNQAKVNANTGNIKINVC